MKRKLITLSALAFTVAVSQASLHINAGAGAADGQGPGGADANYLGYDTGGNEQNDTGALEVFNGISFAEGGLAGTYNVGVEITWPDNTSNPGANNTKQSYGRNSNGYSDFWQDWVGVDHRTSQGGIGVGTSFQLNLTGLAANQQFTLTSYHFDTDNQSGNFTTSASGATVYEWGDADGVSNINTSAFAYDYSLTSDASGNASITYTYAGAGGIFIGINGFDLAAVPEPATFGMVALFGGGILFIRRRFMM